MNTLYPWHSEQWRDVMGRIRSGSIPHALLLTGPAGLGKNQFATSLAQTLLCEKGGTSGQACGQCRSCLLYTADSHPDQRIVSPVEAGKVITVDQVREASQYLNQTSQYGGFKLLIITPADQMNINAANSLLKTLEEPSSRSLILLISARPGRLPATILSRCQNLKFTTPSSSQALQWLKGQINHELNGELLLNLAEGAPLRALQLVEDDVFAKRLEVIKGLEDLAGAKGSFSYVAEQFLKIGVQQTLYWMYNWTADMIRYTSSGSDSYMVNRDLEGRLVHFVQKASLQGMHNYMQQLNDALRLVDRQLNHQLLMENILMSWQETFPQTR